MLDNLGRASASNEGAGSATRPRRSEDHAPAKSFEQLDFIVIGAQKAGTTSVFEHLRAHPDLYLPPGKEQPFFSHDHVYAVGWREFAATRFPAGATGARCGKVTPWYMAGSPLRGEDATAPEPPPYLPGQTERIIPDRIHGHFPQIKLIAILRDPVDRAISAFRMTVLGGARRDQSMDRAIADLLSPAALDWSRRQPMAGYITWGEYGRILESYYRVFPREQLFVCFTDELERAPRELMGRMFDFLGVDRGFVPPTLETRYLEGAVAPRVRWLRSPSMVQKKLVSQPVVRSLWRLMPEKAQRGVIAGLREANYRFDLWNRRRQTSDQLQPSEETLSSLRAHYEGDRGLLEQVIDKPVPWPASDVDR